MILMQETKLSKDELEALKKSIVGWNATGI